MPSTPPAPSSRPLSVPRALADRKNTSPRARTQNSPKGPPPTRVSRLDRKRPADTGQTSIPIVEADEADDGAPSYGSLDLSNIEIEIT